MQRVILAGLLLLTVLTGCGGHTISRARVYGPHCFQFRERHLLVFHKTYYMKFYQSSSFYRYLHLHPHVQYRRVSCSYFHG